MKVVILAAGKGSRLGNELPKPLICLSDGLSILEHQIRHLKQYLSIDEILLVVGYKKELFLEAFPDLFFVYSPNFAKENTSKSLLRAIKKIDDDLLWINADVVFHPSVLQKLLEGQRLRKNYLLVNEGTVGDEEVKYRCDQAGKISEVSKHVVKASGEALGLNFFTVETLPLFKKHLEYCSDSDYFEKGIEGCIAEGTEVWPCPVDRHLCTEIDFPEDLTYASQLLKSWKDNPRNGSSG